MALTILDYQSLCEEFFINYKRKYYSIWIFPSLHKSLWLKKSCIKFIKVNSFIIQPPEIFPCDIDYLHVPWRMNGKQVTAIHVRQMIVYSSWLVVSELESFILSRLILRITRDKVLDVLLTSSAGNLSS